MAPGLLSRRGSQSPTFLLILPGLSPWALKLFQAGQCMSQRWMEEAVHSGGGVSSTQLQTSGHSQATQQAVRGRLHSKWKIAKGMLESTSGVLRFFKMSFSKANFEKQIFKGRGN